MKIKSNIPLHKKEEETITISLVLWEKILDYLEWQKKEAKRLLKTE